MGLRSSIGRSLKAIGKQLSLELQSKVRGSSQPGLNPACQQVLCGHSLGIWVLAAPGWPGVLESRAEASSHCPFWTHPSCCDNSILCATGSSLWLGFQIAARALIEAAGSIMWAQESRLPIRPPAQPGLITGHGSLVVRPDSGHPEPGPPRGQAWAPASSCSLRLSVGPPSLSYWG